MSASEVETIEAGRITEARLIEIVFPGQANHYGSLFGGQALALMDKAAFVVGSRFTRSRMVTACSERVDFHVPVHQGELVELVAKIADTGRTSVVIDVELYAEDLVTGQRRLGTRGRFVLVAVDEHGKPQPVPRRPDATSGAS